MGAGGIIQQRAEMLVPIAMDPKFYPKDPELRDALEVVARKPMLERDADDLRLLGGIINQGCQPGC